MRIIQEAAETVMESKKEEENYASSFNVWPK